MQISSLINSDFDEGDLLSLEMKVEKIIGSINLLNVVNK